MAASDRDPDFSNGGPKTLPAIDSGVPLENSVFCSVSGIPLLSSSSDPDQDVLALTRPIKVEKIEDEDENCSEDPYPEIRGEVLSTATPEASSDVHLQSAVFCSVRGLPLVDRSASSTGYDVSSLTQQIKVETIKDEDLSSESSSDGRWHYSPGASPSPVPTGSSIIPENSMSIKVEDAAEENDAPKKNQKLDFTETSQETDGTHYVKETFITCSEGDGLEPFVAAPADNVTSKIANEPECPDILTDESSCSGSEQCSWQSYKNASAICSVVLSPSVSSSSIAAFSCDQCSAQFRRKCDLRMHSFSHSTARTFSCNQCSAQFKQKHHLQNHLLSHSDTRAFSCDQCFARFKRKGDLKMHLLSHSDARMFSCDQCSARFTRNGRLKEHLLTHSDEKAFPCDQCSARFKRKGDLRHHMLTHYNERAFPCDQCSARFKRKRDLQTHLLIHSNEKAFTCEQCSAKFRRKSRLNEHMLSHSNERAFPCDLCSARFKRKPALNRHMLSHL